MKSRILSFFILLLLFSCGPFFEGHEDYREGSESGNLINEGSLIGKWEETYQWENGGEFSDSWEPVNIRYSDNYIFKEDNTFTSTNKISDCTGSNGTYIIEEKEINLNYICESQPEIIKEILINEFFFREQYVVFIQKDENGYIKNISKFELVKETKQE